MSKPDPSTHTAKDIERVRTLAYLISLVRSVADGKEISNKERELIATLPEVAVNLIAATLSGSGRTNQDKPMQADPQKNIPSCHRQKPPCATAGKPSDVLDYRIPDETNQRRDNQVRSAGPAIVLRRYPR